VAGGAGCIRAYRVWPDVAPQAVEPCDPCDRVSRLGDPGVPGLQGQAPALEPRGRDCLGWQHALPLCLQAHTGVRVADACRLPPVAVRGGREGGFEGRFQPLPGHGGESGGQDSPWRGACLGREALGSLPPARLAPGLERPSQGGDGVQRGPSRLVVAALATWGAVRLQDTRSLLVAAGMQRSHGLVACASWSEALAVWLDRRLPGWCPYELRQPVRRSLLPHGHASRALCRGAGLGNPDPAYRCGLEVQAQRMGEASPLGRGEGLHAVHSGGVLPTGVLRHPAGGHACRIPGLPPTSLPRADGLAVPTTTGAGASLVALADRPLTCPPRDVWPCIPRTRVRGPAVCTPTGRAPVHTPGLTSAYPRAFPAAFASWALPPPGRPAADRLRLGSTCTQERRPGGFTVPAGRVASREGRALRRGCGVHAREGGSHGPGDPVRCGPRRSARVGVSVLTTVGVARSRAYPSRPGSQASAVGLGVLLPCTPGESHAAGGQPLACGWNPLPCTAGVGVGRVSAPTPTSSDHRSTLYQRSTLPLRLPSPWVSPSFGRTGHSPLRPGRAPFTHPVPQTERLLPTRGLP